MIGRLAVLPVVVRRKDDPSLSRIKTPGRDLEVVFIALDADEPAPLQQRRAGVSWAIVDRIRRPASR